jgi:hypothetical protein
MYDFGCTVHIHSTYTTSCGGIASPARAFETMTPPAAGERELPVDDHLLYFCELHFTSFLAAARRSPARAYLTLDVQYTRVHTPFQGDGDGDDGEEIEMCTFPKHSTFQATVASRDTHL